MAAVLMPTATGPSSRDFSDIASSFSFDSMDNAFVDVDSPPISRPGSPTSFGAAFMPADLFKELVDSDMLPDSETLGSLDHHDLSSPSFNPLDSIKDTLYTPPQSPTRSPTHATNQCRPTSCGPEITPVSTDEVPSAFDSFSLDDMDLLMIHDSEISDALLMGGFAPIQHVATANSQKAKSKGGAKRTKAIIKPKTAPKRSSSLSKPTLAPKLPAIRADLLKDIDGPLDPNNKVHKKTLAALKRAQATEAATEAVREAQALSAEDPGARRLTHNVLERKRRNDLKNSYQELRECIPDIEDNERTPTGQILIKAMEHVTFLKEREAKTLHRIASSRKENLQLRGALAAAGIEAQC